MEALGAKPASEQSRSFPSPTALWFPDPALPPPSTPTITHSLATVLRTMGGIQVTQHHCECGWGRFGLCADAWSGGAVTSGRVSQLIF